MTELRPWNRDPDLLVRAAPALDSTGFLEAGFKHGEDAPLLPGRVAIYRDGIFVGRGQMALTAREQPVRLGFGADDRVKIERTIVSRTEGSAGLIATSKTDQRDYKTSVRNGHDRRSASRSRINCRSARSTTSRSSCCRDRRRPPSGT